MFNGAASSPHSAKLRHLESVANERNEAIPAVFRARVLITASSGAHDSQHLTGDRDDHDSPDPQLLDQFTRQRLGAGGDEDAVEGTRLRQPQSSWRRRLDPRILNPVIGQSLPRAPYQLFMPLNTDHTAVLSDKDPEQRRRPAGA